MRGSDAVLSLPPRARQLLRDHPLAAIVVVGVLLRLALTPLTAHLPNGLTDEGFWKHWMEAIDAHGVLNIFRTTDTDYVGYHWVLWTLNLVYRLNGGPYSDNDFALHILVKLPSIVFDVVLILVVYQATRVLVRSHARAREQARTAALVAAAVIAFHPAVLYDGPVWAQTDSAITAAMLGALLLAALRRPFGAGMAIGLGLAVKPHPVIIGPVLLILLWRNGGLRAILWAAGGLVLVAGVVLGPWMLHGDSSRILDVYDTLFTKDRERLSELAWNQWWIFDQRGDPRPGSRIWEDFPLTFRAASTALSVLAGMIGIAYAWVRPGLRSALVAAAYLAFAFYALPIGSHERYLYPFLGLMLPVILLDRRWLWLYLATSTTFFLNLVVVAPPVESWMDRWVYGGFGVATAATNTALFAAFTLVLLADLLPVHDSMEQETRALAPTGPAARWSRFLQMVRWKRRPAA